ncbi:MAG: leucine-rich repeat domain-containing protein [Lachnospiraceae bacterium]|nr:leucine-rich repeat domain-containing protein [Lachnospiraceae bacterium]
MKTNKGIKIAAVFGILSFLVILGYYLFSHWVHVPQWLTFPYDVSIYRGKAVINEYLSEEREISIPEKIMGIKVCNINEDAFNRVGEDAVILEIPEGVGAGKVYHQESQSYYWLIGNDARMLEYAGNEKKYEVQEEVWGRKVTKICSSCFGNSNIEEVTIPETVTDIDGFAFEGCTNLKQVMLPSNLEQISVATFWNCRNLKQIILPPNLERIGNAAFEGSGLENIDLPESIKEIGYSAFEDTAVKKIAGLENVEYIGDYAFRGTPWEEDYEGDFVCIGDVLYMYKGDDDVVVIPTTIREIRGAFYRKEGSLYPISVKKVFVPDSVRAISAYSFENQEGIEVYIPASVTELGDSCFFYVDKDSIFGDGAWDGEPRTIVTTSASPAHVYAKEQSLHYRISTRDEMREEMEEALREQNDGE